MKINSSTRLQVALSLVVVTFLSAIPISAYASADPDTTVVHIEHLQRLDDVRFLSEDAVLAARWIATADFYADQNLLHKALADATVVRIDHLQRLDDVTFLSDDAVLAARWLATADFYADLGLLYEALADATVVRIDHLQRIDGLGKLTATNINQDPVVALSAQQ